MHNGPRDGRRDAHTDVPPNTPQRMATLWIALQDVSPSLGPTMVHPADPAALAARIDWVKQPPSPP